MINQYGKLTEAEVKALVVDDKWLATLTAEVNAEMDHVSQGLTGRIKELTERYDKPLSAIEGEVEALSAQVMVHLQKMGVAWK